MKMITSEVVKVIRKRSVGRTITLRAFSWGETARLSFRLISSSEIFVESDEPGMVCLAINESESCCW